MNDFRRLTQREVTRLRLILSTFQDGTGQLAAKGGATLPGWRDFERTIAFVLGGEAQESKAIFDVLFSHPQKEDIYVGVSCKMRRTLGFVESDGRVTIELPNSAGKFWEALAQHKLNQRNYRKAPTEVGESLINLVEKWHHEARDTVNAPIDVGKSFYLVLSWSRSGWYQLHQFPLKLLRPAQWHFPDGGRRLVGQDKSGILYEWYGESGGQLKYYPSISNALWYSERFRLEPLPSNRQYGLANKAASYFPELWEQASTE